ncbi:hypothetical conserved protein [Candidatus Nitrosoglobus terrae]|uniref:Hypothetical conserved protein n=1 Tax=Candidatus Nitrosoglobus terrae TaxID=1630141 RepID=A0A1Q2SPJ3_9GAMM|nr:porin [Candidatus Nitrosoglobus terrae]BAW81054.1 hypothetical conserved protein [Candidatus Nitrosoglobus terrae]
MEHFKKTRLAVVAAVMGLSLPAKAIVVVGGDNGWEVSFDGNINQFYVWSDPSGRPDNPTASNPLGKVIGGNMTMDPFSQSSSRFRTGLMPALFGFNVKAPTWHGLDIGGRISFAGQTNNDNSTNNTLGSFGGVGGAGTATGIQNSSNTTNLGGNFEFREGYFTIDGTFGQILAGRTLDLFMGKNILTDQTLFGVGGTGNVHGGGFTLGRIGFGYLYPGFNAQVRWTSPDMNGLKISLAAVDPSQLCGAEAVGGQYVAASGANCIRTTNTPRGEGLASYVGTFTDGSFQVWGSGMWQSLEREPIDINPTNKKNDVWGWSTGAQVKYRGWDFNGSYYAGAGLGTSFLMAADSMDADGNFRRDKGWIAQGGYTFLKHTKIAFSYGVSRENETATDAALRLSGAGATIKDQQAYVAGIYHDVNANLKLVAEYSRIINEWYGHGNRQEANVVGVGGFFFW